MPDGCYAIWAWRMLLRNLGMTDVAMQPGYGGGLQMEGIHHFDVLPPLNRYATLVGDSYGTSAAAIHDRIGDRLATPPRPIP